MIINLLMMVSVFLTEIPPESCTDTAALDQVVAFNQTCYEMHLKEGNSFAQAEAYCKKQNGELWHHVDGDVMRLVVTQLERNKNSMKVTSQLDEYRFRSCDCMMDGLHERQWPILSQD